LRIILSDITIERNATTLKNYVAQLFTSQKFSDFPVWDAIALIVSSETSGSFK